MHCTKLLDKQCIQDHVHNTNSWYVAWVHYQCSQLLNHEVGLHSADAYQGLNLRWCKCAEVKLSISVCFLEGRTVGNIINTKDDIELRICQNYN